MSGCSLIELSRGKFTDEECFLCLQGLVVGRTSDLSEAKVEVVKALQSNADRYRFISNAQNLLNK